MIASVDDGITVWIATHRWAPLDPLFVGLGTVEKLGAIWIGLAVVVGLVRWGRDSKVVGLAALVALVLFAADAATFGIKDLVMRPRPFVAHRQIHPLYVVHSSSFPAGHAATAFAGAVLLSWIARRATPAFVALAVAVAFSRIYVGDHYLGDVIAGAFVGAVIALAVVVVSELVLERRRSRAGRPGRRRRVATVVRSRS